MLLNDYTDLIDTYTGHYDVSPDGGVCWMGDPALPIDFTQPSMIEGIADWPPFAWDDYNPEYDNLEYDPELHAPIAQLYANMNWI